MLQFSIWDTDSNHHVIQAGKNQWNDWAEIPLSVWGRKDLFWQGLIKHKQPAFNLTSYRRQIPYLHQEGSHSTRARSFLFPGAEALAMLKRLVLAQALQKT